MATFTDKPKATGKVVFKLFDKDGNLKDERHIENLVVTTGLNHIAGRMATTGIPNQMSHMALGEGVVSPALGNTALGSQLGRVSLTTAGGTPSGATVTYAATFPAGTATGAVTEAGIFNNSTGGTMLCRTTFSVINKGSADALAVTWEVTIS